MPIRAEHRFRPQALCWAALALGVVLWSAGCGLKTPPRPLSQVLPATAGLRAWQREAAVLVSWQLPATAEQERYGGVRGFVIAVQGRPQVCLDCALPPPRRVVLAIDAAELQRQGARLFYALPLEADGGRLTVGVQTRFGLGLAPEGSPVVVTRAGAIPAPALAWRWSGGGESGGARSVQFSWEPRQERVVQTLGTDGQPRERVQYYRANLYRRLPPSPWPALPLNGEPLQAMSWIVPPLQAEFPPGVTGEAYQLRYVDQFANEGPASPEVLIPLSGRRP